MGKKSDSRTPEENLRRRVAKAQADLLDAQRKRSAAVLKGEREVERVRRKTNNRVVKATENVERRATALAKLETDVEAVHRGRMAEADGVRQ